MSDAKLLYQLPKNADKDLLAEMIPKALRLRNAANQELHERFARQAAALGSAFKLMTRESKVAPEVAAEHKAEAERWRAMAKRRPRKPAPMKGHNPVRFPPFDLPYTWSSAVGIDFLSLPAPDPTTGQVGADIGFAPTGGGVTAVSSVGFWFWSQTEGTLQITATAQVGGSAYAYCPPFLGFISAGIAVRTYVEEYVSSGAVNVFQGIWPFWSQNGVVAVSLTEFGWDSYDSFLTMPVQASTQYSIWTDIIQYADGGGIAYGVSDIEAFINTVSYQLL